MSKTNAFEKKHGEEDLLNDASGVLDALNLPPAFVEYVRKNLKIIQIGLGVVVVLTVFFSLYGSYKEKRTESATSALAMAIKESDDLRVTALKNVISEYSRTSASLWAKVELSHDLMVQKEFSAAASSYGEIINELKSDNPAYDLTVFAKAQAEEASGDNVGAMTSYNLLLKSEGYKGLAYSGLARLYEMQGDMTKALEISEQYKAEVATLDANHPERILIEEKVARLRSAL